MAPLLNNQWERFCLAIFKGKTQTDAAIEAGYNSKWARSTASRLSTNTNIQNRLKELQERAASAKIMNVIERKERLSEIARARLPDFLVGDEPYLNASSPNAGAVEGYKVNTRWKDGEAITSREIKLHSPVQAIAELNKMEGEYPAAKVDLTTKGKEIKLPPVYQVVDEETKELLKRIENGERTATVETDTGIQG